MSESSTLSSQQPPIILAVDDNPINLSVLSKYLGNHGYRVLIARSGKGALRTVKEIKPDIILLDVMMPELNGFETCEQLKADETTKDIPVIFMTALSRTEDKVRGFEAGAVDYVTKPLQESEILARISTHLQIRHLMKSLQEQNVRLEASNAIGRQVSSVLDLEQLLATIVKLIQEKFGYYFVGVWLFDESKRELVLQVAAGSKELTIQDKLCIALNDTKSIIAEVGQTGQSYLAEDVRVDDKYLLFDELPDTCSELALPLRLGGELLGVLDVQSTYLSGFSAEDQMVLQTLASQVAVAIRNAHLYKLEKQLHHDEQERANQLAELNANKDKFFAIISHDLRTPFNSLLGNSQLLLLTLDQVTKTDIQEMVESIYNSAKTSYNLLDNLLTWAMMQRGQMAYQPENLRLHELVEESISLLSDMASSKNNQLRNLVAQEVRVYADKNMLNTVIRNLISNALKFTENGEVIIAAKVYEKGATAKDSSGRFAQVSVADTGVGIAPNNLDKLFDIGTHHTTNGTAQESGTGLGLLLCQEMVHKNGGTIAVESDLGKGTAVIFDIPTQY